MYHVSAQGVDERMINVHYYYYYYFHPATFIDRLHLALRTGLEVGKPNNIPANNKRTSNGHSRGGQRKRT